MKTHDDNNEDIVFDDWNEREDDNFYHDPSMHTSNEDMDKYIKKQNEKEINLIQENMNILKDIF